MKELRVTFTDAEFNRLKKSKNDRKGRLNWHQFILLKCAGGISIKKDLKNDRK